jgi:hypothetical protein
MAGAVITDPRSPATQQAAQEAFVEAEAAASAASADVDAQRVLVEMGRAPYGSIVKAQRANARAQEALEQARARVKAVERAAAELRSAEQAERESRRAATARELSTERDELEARWLSFLARTEDEAAAIDREIGDWAARAQAVRSGVGGVQPGSLTQPSKANLAYGRFLDGLRHLRRLYGR